MHNTSQDISATSILITLFFPVEWPKFTEVQHPVLCLVYNGTLEMIFDKMPLLVKCFADIIAWHHNSTAAFEYNSKTTLLQH